MRRVQTDRLVLEPVTTANAAVLWRIMQSANLREYQDVPRYTREEFQRRVFSRPRHFDARSSGRFEWLLVLAETNQAMGWVSLRIGDHAHSVAEIGYSLMSGFRRRGYALEASRAIVDLAFEDTDLGQVDACCVPGNLASRKLLSKLGFAEVRVQRNGAIVRGRPVDIAIYELPRERWQAERDAVLAQATNTT
jgi:RimJ/RimL family protein N-acetyltransferase